MEWLLLTLVLVKPPTPFTVAVVQVGVTGRGPRDGRGPKIGVAIHRPNDCTSGRDDSDIGKLGKTDRFVGRKKVRG